MTTTQNTAIDRVSGLDIGRVNSLSRRYARGTQPDAIDEAAELLELCLSPEEEKRVLWWWNEGCRDYADSMEHLAELNAELLARRAELFPKN